MIVCQWLQAIVCLSVLWFIHKQSCTASLFVLPLFPYVPHEIGIVEILGVMAVFFWQQLILCCNPVRDDLGKLFLATEGAKPGVHG